MTFNRVLITGAAGGLGKQLRANAKHYGTTLRLSDIADLGEAASNEELFQCDLGDLDAVMELTKDVDTVVHLGGIALENTFENILNANIRGTYNLYESCRKNGIKRVVFASSNHAIGFYEREARIGSNVPHRPDSIYGVSKSFGEDLARYYFDKFGIETVVIRIGSCFEEPRDRRMLATWMSYRDFIQLVERSLKAPRVGFLVVYGSSDNYELFWDNSAAELLGYRPQDSAEDFRAKVEAATPVPDPTDPAVKYIGGGFVPAGHYED
jgi:uronate dehydrogenase